MKPMLARTLGPQFTRFPVFAQPKLNGVRALYQNGTFQSSDEKVWSYLKLRHLVDELISFNCFLGNLMLDGELYVHGWRLQKINGAIAVNSDTPRDDTHLVEFHVFDIIDDRGFRCPFSERFLDNRGLLEHLKMVKVVETSHVHTRVLLDQYFKRWCSLGYEGLMARPDGPYEVGETPHGTQKRSEFLWKYKAWKDAEYKCVGFTMGEGKASNGIGALVLKNAYGNTFNCGTGFTDTERTELLANPPINKLVRVRYVEMTSDGIPYPCAFLCVME